MFEEPNEEKMTEILRCKYTDKDAPFRRFHEAFIEDRVRLKHVIDLVEWKSRKRITTQRYFEFSPERCGETRVRELDEVLKLLDTCPRAVFGGLKESKGISGPMASVFMAAASPGKFTVADVCASKALGHEIPSERTYRWDWRTYHEYNECVRKLAEKYERDLRESAKNDEDEKEFCAKWPLRAMDRKLWTYGGGGKKG